MTAPTTLLANPRRSATGEVLTPPAEVAAFHRRLDGYGPTRLVDLPAVAARLGVRRVLVKAEVERFGLPSFKVLGASWATYRALVDHVGEEPAAWQGFAGMAERFAPLRPFALAAATDGNHGRAVARMARHLGFECRIFVPEGTVPPRIAAIESEGASVTMVDGDYDLAVARSAEEAGDRCLVISDTSWPGYEVTPRRVIEGYSTILHEIDEQVAAAGAGPVDALYVPVGVGALMAAVVGHHGVAAGRRPTIVGVEPADAACVQASARAGELVTVPGPHRSIMAGLNCGTPSLTAWPTVSAGVDWFCAMDDEWARAAMVALADEGVVAGETGAAALGAALALVEGPGAGDLTDDERAALGLTPEATLLLLDTEGATDPVAYEAIVGQPPEAVGA